MGGTAMPAKVLYAAFSALVFLFPCSRTALPQDHLEPEQGALGGSAFDLKYMVRVHQLLVRETESVEMIRVICLPSLTPEWSLTVRKDELTDKWEIELLPAQKRIWMEQDPARVGVTRKTASVDSRTADAIVKAWKKMLIRTRYNDPGIGVEELVQDGVDYHFMAFRPVSGSMSGQCTDPDNDKPGATAVGSLILVSGALKTYVDSSERDRPMHLKLVAKRVRELEGVLTARQ